MSTKKSSLFQGKKQLLPSISYLVKRRGKGEVLFFLRKVYSTLKTSPLRTLLGFTLVELIVVITILTILGTLGFLSVKDYSKNSRDANRSNTMRSLVSALNLYQIESGVYPTPEGSVSTGTVANAIILSYKWEIGPKTTSLIRFSDKFPKDPLTEASYVYGVSANRMYFQIAGTFENLEATNNFLPFIDTAYAAGTLRARVNGNYLWYLKYSSGAETWITNIPSLIYTNTGTVDLSPSNTNITFVVNNETNLPYIPSGTVVPTPKTPTELVQVLQKNTSASFTWINISTVTDTASLASVFTGSTLASFWGTIEIVETAVLGKNASSSVSGASSCALTGSTVPHGTTVTAYSETAILWNAAYDCTNRQTTRTCTNGVLSGDTSYTYASCVKWTPNACSSNPSYSHNSHTYSIPALNHGSGATNILSSDVSENNGTFKYTLSTINCNDGVLGSASENGTPTVQACNSSYHIEGNACVSDTNTVSCGGSNPWTTAATLGTATTTITWNGTSWNTASNWTHSSSAPSTCQYQCKAGYYYNGSTCVQTTAGNYTSTAWATTQTQCTAGYYCTAWSASATQNICPANSYCPTGSATPTACGGGMTSPAGSTSVGACVAPRWEQLYINPWSYTWTVPAGVTSVSVVCVGGGALASWWVRGGNWWALRYINNTSVSPGSSLSVVVWWIWWTSSFSSVLNAGNYNSGSPIGWNIGWGNGGVWGYYDAAWAWWWAGGAWGYSGNGWVGWAGWSGWSWNGGWWAGWYGWWYGWWGWWVGLYWLWAGWSSNSAGWSGWNNWWGWGYCTGCGWAGGNYWWWSWSWPSSAWNWACRIIWPGTTRQFPSTDVGP